MAGGFSFQVMWREGGAEYARTWTSEDMEDARLQRGRALLGLLTPAAATDVEVLPIRSPRRAA